MRVLVNTHTHTHTHIYINLNYSTTSLIRNIAFLGDNCTPYKCNELSEYIEGSNFKGEDGVTFYNIKRVQAKKTCFQRGSPREERNY